MLPGHKATVESYEAHPGRDCVCRAHKAVCSCGWEERTGVDGRVAALDAITGHRLDCIEQAIVASVETHDRAGTTDQPREVW